MSLPLLLQGAGALAVLVALLCAIEGLYAQTIRWADGWRHTTAKAKVKRDLLHIAKWISEDPATAEMLETIAEDPEGSMYEAREKWRKARAKSEGGGG